MKTSIIRLDLHFVFVIIGNERAFILSYILYDNQQT